MLWFACVFAARAELGPGSYIIATVGAVCYQSILKPSLKVWAMLFGLTLIGIAFDTLALKQSWIVLQNEQASWFAPHWLLALWLCFGMSLLLYQKLLGHRLVLSSIVGLIFGPLSYAGGEKLEVLHFSNNTSLIYYAIFWALYFPFSLALLKKINPAH